MLSKQNTCPGSRRFPSNISWQSGKASASGRRPLGRNLEFHVSILFTVNFYYALVCRRLWYIYVFSLHFFYVILLLRCLSFTVLNEICRGSSFRLICKPRRKRGKAQVQQIFDILLSSAGQSEVPTMPRVF